VKTKWKRLFQMIRIGALVMRSAGDTEQGKLGLVIEALQDAIEGDYRALFEDKLYTVFSEEIEEVPA